MSTAVIAEPENEISNSMEALTRIRNNFVACRVKFKWFGTNKALTADQKSRAAESFGAEGAAISAAKRLIDTKHASYRSLTSIKSQINRYWRDSSLPYPESGIRLIRSDAVDEFNSSLIAFNGQLGSAVAELNTTSGT